MPNSNKKAERAKIFMPFDSLTGFSGYLREKERILVEKKLLSEYDCEQLNKTFIQLKKMDMVKVIYYEEGEYIELQGVLTKIDFDIHKTIQIVNKVIRLSDIKEISIIR